jgi:hypothetical protein
VSDQEQRQVGVLIGELLTGRDDVTQEAGHPGGAKGAQRNLR